MLIANLVLDFWNSEPKIAFRGKLEPKIEICLFFLKIGSHTISRMLVPKSVLDFGNFDHKIHFWANLGPKIQTCSFCLEIGAHSISKMLISNPYLDFWNSDPKKNFWASLCPNLLNLSDLSEYRSTYYLKDAHSESRLSFLKFQAQNHL